jgi:hypothetical protein
MDVIEESIPQNSVDFIAESNLSILTEANVTRMRKNGFICIIPGVESWYDYGKKVGTAGLEGFEKVRQISDQLNMIQKSIPYVNVNFILGLDTDHGLEPFELTKKFIDMTPGVYPSFLLFNAFGRASSANIKFQEDNRIIPIPFHVHRSTLFTNIKPRHYAWIEFYDYVIDLLRYTFSNRALYSRFRRVESRILRWFLLAQSLSSGGYGKISFHSMILNQLRTDKQFRDFFERETNVVPDFLRERVKKDLGIQLWSWLPEGALEHDPNAYLKSSL